MGSQGSKPAAPPADARPDYSAIARKLCAQGFRHLQLVFAADFSSSNDWSGAREYGGPMHGLPEDVAEQKGQGGKEGRSVAARSCRYPYFHCMTVCAEVFQLMGQLASGEAAGGSSGGPPKESGKESAKEPAKDATRGAGKSASRSVHRSHSKIHEKAPGAAADLPPGSDPEGTLLVYRFGCLETRDKHVLPLGFPMIKEARCRLSGLQEVYRTALKAAVKSGPTSLIPLCSQLVEQSRSNPSVPIVCVAVTDADVPAESGELRATVDALAEMSSRPIAMVVVGVGDGEFPVLRQLDTVIRFRKFDNLHFTHLTRFCVERGSPRPAGSRGARKPRSAKVVPTASEVPRTPELDRLLAEELFSEVPRQLQTMRELNLHC